MTIHILPISFNQLSNENLNQFFVGRTRTISYSMTSLKKKVVRQAHPYSSYRARTYNYGWGGYNSLDLSVDESGLWALYSYSSYSGNSHAFESMSSMGNAFVACGVVYSIDEYYSTTATINYAYDTTSGSGSYPGIKFVKKFTFNSMVTYNPREKVLYAWDRNRQISPLKFEFEDWSKLQKLEWRVNETDTNKDTI